MKSFLNLTRVSLSAIFCVTALTCFAFSAEAQTFEIPLSVIAGGGGASSASGIQVEGTIGQAVTGVSTGGNFEVASGFWHAATALLPTVLTLSDAGGVYGSPTSLTATLVAQGSPLSGRIISFILNGSNAGTATTNASGIATLSNVSLTGINAGSYPGVVAAAYAGDSDYAPVNATALLTVTKATPTVSVTGGTFVYDGQAHPATGAVTGVAAENLGSPAFTYNGSSSAPVNVGTYSVTGSFAGNTNYNPVTNSAQSITITRATATVSLSNLTHGYDGTPKNATVTTTPSGLNVVITYSQNGQAVASPTQTGSYDVLATVSDANYQGSAAGILNITTTLPPPTITGINPACAPASGGNSVTLIGTGFVSGATVTFGGSGALSVTFINGTSLSATVPARPSGMADVVVRNPDGQTATFAGFTYGRRGDANGDCGLTVADVFYLVNNLFAGGPAPQGNGDANSDGTVSVADVFYLVNHLFAGGPAPVQ